MIRAILATNWFSKTWYFLEMTYFCSSNTFSVDLYCFINWPNMKVFEIEYVKKKATIAEVSRILSISLTADIFRKNAQKITKKHFLMPYFLFSMPENVLSE